MPVHPTGMPLSRSARLDQAMADLLREAPELEAAAVVSCDALPMASALPATMDEDRVAAMSAALLSLGERAAQGLGRGELSQVYIEGESGTVFLVSADDEAVLVAVAVRGAKAGMMLYEVRRAAGIVAAALRADRSAAERPAGEPARGLASAPVPEQTEPIAQHTEIGSESVPVSYAAPAADAAGDSWSSYAPGGTLLPSGSRG